MDQKRIDLLRAIGYSDKAIGFILHKTNAGEIPQPSAIARHQGTCGDVMILYLRIEKNIIQDARYDYIGCAGMQAAASAVTEMIRGLSLESAAKIQSRDILAYLGGLPPQKHECAQLASNTVKKALETYAGQAS